MTSRAPVRNQSAIRDPKSAIVALALCTLATACASTGAKPRPFPVPGGADDRVEAPPIPAPGPTSPSGAADGIAVAHTALGLRGIRYRPGGTGPDVGFDCSGFVQYVYAQYGVYLPRLARDQFRVGQSVPAERLEPGDLVFFQTEGREISHVGIFIGGERFVHAPNSRSAVRVSSLDSPYWRDRFRGVRRVIDATETVD
ncbi:MAG TPA: C40 family peptidase [Vicinamibacterales bacterium]